MLSLDSSHLKVKDVDGIYAGFYPAEEVDTADYTLANEQIHSSDFMLSLDSRSIKTNAGADAFGAFYLPEEDDSSSY